MQEDLADKDARVINGVLQVCGCSLCVHVSLTSDSACRPCMRQERKEKAQTAACSLTSSLQGMLVT